MNEQLTQKLLDAAPLLYREAEDKNSDKSFAHFGFEISDGWFNLLYDLSINLEKLIQKQPDDRIVCAISKYSFRNLIRHIDWIGEYTIYLFIFLCRAIYSYIYHPILKGNITKLFPNAPEMKLFWNSPERPKVNGELIDGFIYEAYDNRLRAIQVKSKFGGLRFYTDGNKTSKMHELIDKAESKSYTICEQCGEPGKSRSGGWIETLCESCFISRENKKIMRDVIE